jgi:hypothetical protein
LDALANRNDQLDSFLERLRLNVRNLHIGEAPILIKGPNSGAILLNLLGH